MFSGSEGACFERQISHSILHVDWLWKSCEKISCCESDKANYTWGRLVCFCIYSSFLNLSRYLHDVACMCYLLSQSVCLPVTTWCHVEMADLIVTILSWLDIPNILVLCEWYTNRIMLNRTLGWVYKFEHLLNLCACLTQV